MVEPKKPVPVTGQPLPELPPSEATPTQTILAGSVRLVYEALPPPKAAKRAKVAKLKRILRPKKTKDMGCLATWIDLNRHLLICDEIQAAELLDQEVRGRARKMFILRIHARFNKVRAHRERKALVKLARDFGKGTKETGDDCEAP